MRREANVQYEIHTRPASFDSKIDVDSSKSSTSLEISALVQPALNFSLRIR